MVKTDRQRNISPIAFLKINLPLSNKWTINLIKDKKNELDVFHNIDLYIEERKTEVVQATLGVIGVMKEHLLKFQEYTHQAITFDSFDYQFYKDFVKYLTYDYPLIRRKQEVKGLRVNSIGKNHQVAKNISNK